MTRSTIGEAVKSGATLAKASRAAGICPRTVQRWRANPETGDQRVGPRTSPRNKLSGAERKHVMTLVNSQEFRNLPPKQIVPRLADKGIYVASESTVYRLLLGMASSLIAALRGLRRSAKRPKIEHVACRLNQVWSWDITYLRGPVRGSFLYLYLIVDVFSRGSTMLATLQWLGIVPSFSRPSVSDDNAFSEALFRTLKYRPSFPSKGFASEEAAATWVTQFVAWYNGEHRHSGIKFVTPDERHSGRELHVLAARHELYERVRAARPELWTTATRAERIHDADRVVRSERCHHRRDRDPLSPGTSETRVIHGSVVVGRA